MEMCERCGYVFSHRHDCPVPTVDRLRAEVRELRKRMQLARGTLRCVRSGQFHTAAMVVYAIRVLDRRRPLPKRRGR